MKNKESILAELNEFISYPTISSDDKNKQAILQCAKWLARHFKSIGMQKAEIYRTSSHPVVYAEYITDLSLKTILFYGHYDVQPIDPIEKWHTLPFKAVIRENYIYGRGSSDDKGQLFIHVKAIESLLKKNERLPVNVKFLIEGSEEIGSKGLKEFIASNKNLLSCDVVVVSDTKMASINVPAISYSLRGSLNAEIFVQTLKKDLHSGTFGSCVPNAAITLSNLISRLHYSDNSIAIPGFYNDVEEVTISERKFMKLNGPSNESLLHDAEIINDWGEKNYSMNERTTIRPSLSVTGFTSGFQGKGVKNVIPSIASVKLNFRLVPKQNPGKIKLLFNNFIKQALPANISVKVMYSSFANPVTVLRNSPYIKAAVKAYENVFRQKVKLIRSGGTIAAVDYLNTILNIPVVLMGFAQVSDNMHAPNEKMYVPNFFKGIDTSIQFIRNVATIPNKITLHATAHY